MRPGSRIAIVGAGMSGLAAAHELYPEHQITVFEANPYAGGHTNTVCVETERGALHVDTGFIVYNDGNYELLDLHMQQLARVATLITIGRLWRLQPAELPQPDAQQDR